MKITKVNIFLLKRQLKTSMVISRGGFKVRQHTIVQIETDAGVTGLGEAIGNAPLNKAILAGGLAEKILGHDPFNIEKIRQVLTDSEVYFERKGSVICAASAIEMACWDIKGKALEQPVYDLLGGKLHEKLNVYASDIYWQESADAMADYAKGIMDDGFKAVKAHIGYLPPEQEMVRLEAIRNAIGEDSHFMIDINAGYNLIQAKRAFQIWTDIKPFWIEEPLHPDNEQALQQLYQCTNIPLALGENEMRLAGFQRLLELQSLDVCMPDIGRVGGLLETKEIATLCRAYGVPVSLHNFSSGILFAATVHVMASLPNQIYLEMDNSNNAVYDELLDFSLDIEDGHFSTPTVIGLGVRLPGRVIENDCKDFICIQ